MAYRLIRDNVERVVISVEQKNRLEKEGFVVIEDEDKKKSSKKEVKEGSK